MVGSVPVVTGDDVAIVGVGNANGRQNGEDASPSREVASPDTAAIQPTNLAGGGRSSRPVTCNSTNTVDGESTLDARDGTARGAPGCVPEIVVTRCNWPGNGHVGSNAVHDEGVATLTSRHNGSNELATPGNARIANSRRAVPSLPLKHHTTLGDVEPGGGRTEAVTNVAAEDVGPDSLLLAAGSAADGATEGLESEDSEARAVADSAELDVNGVGAMGSWGRWGRKRSPRRLEECSGDGTLPVAPATDLSAAERVLLAEAVPERLEAGLALARSADAGGRRAALGWLGRNASIG